ncbi:hypothetical protein NEDG_00955 [Nematocida displodere]|uniref:Uncharacterized protein n=1 Tax=Nematocida displodere TaxID=1805483 RepID=A0A177EAQ8_9MICR|nr:hypothetical protein NEDG_00955 [Nematocida displodere]
MLDSTIIEKVGRYLTPDEKIKNSNGLLCGMMETKSFKKLHRKRCEETLAALGSPVNYYKKFRKPNLRCLKNPIENVLRARDSTTDPSTESSIIKERVSKLEFLFKKISVYKKSVVLPMPPSSLEENREPQE